MLLWWLFLLGGIKGLAKELFEELAGSIPGIDEAKSFVEVITWVHCVLNSSFFYCLFTTLYSLVNEMDFSVVIFDTAPTGHTLRFLSMPNLFVKGMEKLGKFKGQFGSMFSQVYIIITFKPQGLQHKLCDFYLNEVVYVCKNTWIKYSLIKHSGWIVIITAVVADGRCVTGRGAIIIGRTSTALRSRCQTDKQWVSRCSKSVTAHHNNTIYGNTYLW